jgi:tetratricopeptide (TPR) repeat protein
MRNLPPGLRFSGSRALTTPGGGSYSSRKVPAIDDVRHLEGRLAREPTSQAHAALAEAYRRTGRLDEAIATCRQGLARFPEYATARFVLAKALLDRDEAAAARAEAERFLQADSSHEPALRLAAECALRLADPLGALGYLRRLGVLDPDDRATQGQLRALEVAAGRGRAGESGGWWALLADDTYATVTFAELCVAQGLLDEALAVYSRIVLRRPDHDMARARLAELGRTRTPVRRLRG